MKKLSFIELEREMEKKKSIISRKEDLKKIQGGAQYLIDRDFQLDISNSLSFIDTTVVNDSGTTKSLDSYFYKGDSELIKDETNQYAFFNVAQGYEDYPSTTVPVPTTTLDPEAEWAVHHPLDAIQIYDNAGTASNVANTLPGTHNGVGDAYRHSLWTAMNARDAGIQDALDFGVAHENSTNNNPPAEKNMDLSNNTWGANYYASNPNFTFNEFTQAFNQAVINGDISILDTSEGTQVHPTVPDGWDYDPYNY